MKLTLEVFSGDKSLLKTFMECFLELKYIEGYDLKYNFLSLEE